MFADIFTCFAGELPKELGDLVNLTQLWLPNNAFQGKLYVPSYMRRNIIEICHPKMACVFTGSIPVEFGQLVNLKVLWVQGNQLAGAIVGPVLHAQFGHAHNRVFCACIAQ